MENYAIAVGINADGSACAVGSNAPMRSRRAYGAHRALRHIAGALAKLAGPLRPIAPMPPSARDSSVCPMCQGDHVCPIEWGPVDDDRWWVLSRCGDCGVWAEVVLSNAEAAMLDVTLDRQMAEIRAAADRLDAERMADAAEAFAAALRRDLIVAADF